MRIKESAFASTIATLRKCGSGRRECVVYWTGPIETGGVDASVHPDHDVSSGGYAVREAWLLGFLVQLARAGRTARAQVHTHAHEAFHSRTDDRFPLVHTSGFLSLVIPWFAQRADPLAGAYLCRLGRDGSWQRLPLRHLDLG